MVGGAGCTVSLFVEPVWPQRKYWFSREESVKTNEKKLEIAHFNLPYEK